MTESNYLSACQSVDWAHSRESSGVSARARVVHDVVREAAHTRVSSRFPTLVCQVATGCGLTSSTDRRAPARITIENGCQGLGLTQRGLCNVAQSIVDQGRGVCVLSAEVQEAGRLGLRSAARLQPSVGEVFRFEDVSNANGRRGCPPW